MTNDSPRQVADRLVDFYRVPNHTFALDILTSYVADQGLDSLPRMWHHLTGIVADVYTTAGLVLVEPEDEDEPAATDRYAVYDHHARCLTALRQRVGHGDPAASQHAVDTYAAGLDDADTALWIWITLHLANLVAQGTNCNH